ncbi:Structural maintenance of chromosomes protein 6 [Blomia tropicalis]|nr:Structural maintenance of chromosomes protein 6 [Blomia tropicalis]
MDIDIASTVDGDPGHIMQISLENFMCHENFSLSFGPRINFIIGQNGSGKSAIASALILALGARGSGLASFIRTGQTRAKITVTICNYLNASNKSESYRPEIFGPKITIKRVIYRTGFSSYEVRSSADKVISRKKVEVDNIVKFFQIDVNNPINILTQQVSKIFLIQMTRKTNLNSSVELSTASQNWDNAKKVLANKTAEMKARQYEINCFNKNISDLQKRIQGIETQFDGTSSIESEIARITDEIESLKKMEFVLTEKAVKFDEDDVHLKTNREKLSNDQQNLIATINAHQSEIDRLKRGQTNRYGFNMEELVKHVNEKINLFKKPPYGPLGDYIRLSDSNAAYASECLLKDNLSAFVVDNYDDYTKLQELFTQILGNNRQPLIIVRKYVPLHDISRFEARSNKYKNFFQILNIVQPEVANCLIDYCKIERIVFIPDYDEARSVLLDEDSVPQNCRSAYTKDGDLMYPTTSTQNFRSYLDNGNKIPRVLVSDSRSVIEIYEQEIKKFSQNDLKIFQKLKYIDSKIDNIRREKIKIDESIFEAKSSMSEKVKKLKDLQQQKSTLQSAAVITFKEKIQELEREKKAIQEQIDDERKICDDAKVEYAKALKEMDEKTEKLNTTLNSRNSFNSELNATQTKIEKKKLILFMNNIQMKEYEKMVEIVEHNLSEEENLRNELITIGSENCEEEIETNRSYESITRKALNIKWCIENKEDWDDFDDLEKQKKVIAEYEDLSKLVHESINELLQLRSLITESNDALHQRKIASHNFKFLAVEIVNYCFRMVSNQRNFDGHINGNYLDAPSDENDNLSARKKIRKGQTLDVVIYPRKRKHFESNVEGDEDISLTNIDNHSQVASTMCSSTKSLFDSERLYSTITFIIVLWKMNRSPFKLLDEIDVFMDMVTRKFSYKMFVRFATEHSKKQFIFLSSLETHIENSEVVRVLQMPEKQF